MNFNILFMSKPSQDQKDDKGDIMYLLSYTEGKHNIFLMSQCTV